MKEETTIIELPEPDLEVQEKLVEQSGIRMWLTPATWREHILANKKLFATIAILVFLVVVLSAVTIAQTLTVQDKQDQIVALDKEVRRAETNLKEAEADLLESQEKVYACQQSLETAWKAWDRRNQLMVSVLSNLFTSNSTDIEGDNTTAGAEFLLAQMDCSPGMDSSEIFTNY